MRYWNSVPEKRNSKKRFADNLKINGFRTDMFLCHEKPKWYNVTEQPALSARQVAYCAFTEEHVVRPLNN